MIERYTRPEMGSIWSEAAKYRAWLRVEVAVCEAYARRGRIPADALARIRATRVDLDAAVRYATLEVAGGPGGEPDFALTGLGLDYM